MLTSLKAGIVILFVLYVSSPGWNRMRKLKQKHRNRFIRVFFLPLNKATYEETEKENHFKTVGETNGRKWSQ